MTMASQSCSHSERMCPDLGEIDDLRNSVEDLRNSVEDLRDSVSPGGQESQQGDEHELVQIGLKDDTQEGQNFTKSPNFPDSHELVDHQEVVSMTNAQTITGLLNLNPTQQVQVLTNSGVATVTDSNGAIYLLVSNDTPGTMLHTATTPHETSGINIISSDSLKDIDLNANSTVQIMNTEGIPVSINVNDLLTTINASKNTLLKDDNSSNSLTCSSTQSLLNLTSLSTDSCSSTQNPLTTSQQRETEQYLYSPPAGLPRTQLTDVPNWALHLRDCCLYGDTYTGYVTDAVEVDNVLNLYKKETQSLFAIRQTPSPSKDECADTVRLMWKSQYVPYDGIPFVNVGRRATVMECEYGPRKRNNALKRLIQQHPHQNSKLPNLTCPARLFIKKVRKFPQYRVPSDSDQKVLRQLQEQALKIVRQTGFQTGEIRLYMQLPLPSAHKYHHVATSSSLDSFHREIDNSNITPSLTVDSRVLEKIEEIVRQGFINPFLVRGAAKDFVENHMEVGTLEQPPYKHNKEFYPPLIEIQNIIQQTQAALTSGLLTPLPPPAMPYVHTQKPKRKRSATDDLANSPLLLKKMTADDDDSKKYSDAMLSPTIPSEISPVTHTKSLLTDPTISTVDADTISLTLTDSQLESFSVTNFTYSQLAQLAKIGLLALNNAAKDTTQINPDEVEPLKVEPDSDIRTKTTTLVNSPLPDCDSGTPLLVSCNVARGDKKLNMMHDGGIVVSGTGLIGSLGSSSTFK